MNELLSVTEPLLGGAQYKTISVDGCTFEVFALPYVQLSEPQAGFAFIDSFYTASNAAYFLKKKLASSLEEAGFHVVECRYPYKHLAVAAGLGVSLRNTLIANEVFGTRMALEIVGVRGVFAREISAASLWEHPEQSPVCDSCGACAKVCPQGCFDGGFEPTRCVRHMQEQAFFPDEVSAQAMKNNLWGCDICQRVCRFNRDLPTQEPSTAEKEMFRLENLFAAFSSGKKGCEPYHEMLGSNYLRPSKLLALTLNAMANSPQPQQYEAFARQSINHSDERVRTAAKRLVRRGLEHDAVLNG